MGTLLQRIEEIRVVEHARLRMALGRADSVLRELEQARIEAASTQAPQAIDMFGQPELRSSSSPTGPSLLPLLRAWETFETAIMERLDAWEEQLWPLVRRWDHGEDVSRDVREIARQLSANAHRCDGALNEVRKQASFFGETRATMLVVYRAVDMARKAEEQLVPALSSGSREAADRTAETAAPRGQSAADITQSLRARFRTTDADEETEELEPPDGMVKKFFKWLGGG